MSLLRIRDNECRTLISIILVFTFLIILFTFFKGSASEDAIAPTINKVTMEQKSVKSGDTFDVYVYASDESGVVADGKTSSITVYRVPKDNSEETKTQRVYLKTTDEDGKYVATFTVNKSWTSGNYKVYFLNIVDTYNNAASLMANTSYPQNNPEQFPDTYVSVTGGNSDSVAPTISKITMEQKSVKSGDTFDVYVYAFDESGVVADGKTSSITVYRVPRDSSEETKTQRVYLKTTDEDGKYVATFTVNKSWTSGNYKVYFLNIVDTYNNAASLMANTSYPQNNPEQFPDSYVTVNSEENSDTYNEENPTEDNDPNTFEVEVNKHISITVRYPSTSYSVANGVNPIVYYTTDNSIIKLTQTSVYATDNGVYLGYQITGLKEGKTTYTLVKRDTNSVFAIFTVKVVPETEEPTTQKQEESTSQKQEEPSSQKQEEPTTQKQDEPTTQKQEEPTTQKQEEPTTQKQEEPTTQKQEEPTTQKQEEPTTQKQEEPTTQKQEEPTTQKQEEPTTQKQEEPTTRKDEPTSVIKRNGLADSADKDGVWWYYTDGKIDRTHTGVDQNKYGWWRVENGKVNFNAQGIYQNQYGWWKTTDGEVTFKENSIYQNEYGWWKCKDSKVDFNAQSIYQNQYGWWKTTDGKVTFKENGLFKNQYGTWKVENSKVNFNYNGKYQGKNIKNGKVV